MNRKIEIELIDEYLATSFYVIRFENEEYSEYDKFVEKFDGHENLGEDFEIIIEYLEQIGEQGAIDEFLKREGGSLKAIPIGSSNLRLYCFRVNSSVLILGNGGHKPNHIRAYQDSPELNKYVSDLRESGRKLLSRIRYHSDRTNILDGKLFGDLNFSIETIEL